MDSYNEHDKIKFSELGKYYNKKWNLPNFKEITGTVYKLCNNCGKYKPMTGEYFYKQPNNKNGFYCHCKDCVRTKINKKPHIKPFNDKGELYCYVCKTYKPTSEFYKGEKNKVRHNYSRECKECEAKRKRIRWASGYDNNVEKYFRRILNGCKTRSKQADLNFNLDLEFLLSLFNAQNKKCALSGIDMTTTNGSGKNCLNASIDRIVPSLGYVKENVRLVCNHVNMMRSNLEDSQLLEFCKAIIEYDKLKQNK